MELELVIRELKKLINKRKNTIDCSTVESRILLTKLEMFIKEKKITKKKLSERLME